MFVYLEDSQVQYLKYTPDSHPDAFLQIDIELLSTESFATDTEDFVYVSYLIRKIIFHYLRKRPIAK